MDGRGGTRYDDLTLDMTDDPIALSLRAHAARRSADVVHPICPDVGRRLLLAEATFSDWVLRRVETVRFEDDRNVVREVTIELRVPDDAPVFGDTEKGRYWLVPLAIMWRRTLVDFAMADEDGRAMTMPGLRLTQQLDQSILLAAAAAAGCTTPEPQADAGVRDFVHAIVTGERGPVEEKWKAFVDGAGGSGPLGELREIPAFRQVAERLRGGFSLFTFLRCSQGRHRVLRLSFVEPVSWVYQQPTFERADPDGQRWTYEAGTRRRRVDWYPAALGLSATRVRLQVPAAEHAASYHLEVKAPPGVRIGEATLLAGRPGDPAEAFSQDHLRGSAQTVGLHVVNVPSGSSCRAQLHMRIQTAGWLSTATLSTLGVLVGLWVARRHTDATVDQIDNVVVLLLTGAAAAATFIAHRDHSSVAARLVTLVRFSATASTALLVAAAVLVSFLDASNRTTVRALLTGLMVAAGVLFSHLAVVWLMSLRMERRQGDLSPWDMVPVARPEERDPWWERELATWRALARTVRLDRRMPRPPSRRDDVMELVITYGMDRPAIGIRSAEAWHRTFDRSAASSAAGMVLQLRQVGVPCGGDGLVCPRRTRPECAAFRDRREESDGASAIPVQHTAGV